MKLASIKSVLLEARLSADDFPSAGRSVPSRNSVAGNGIFGCGDWRPKKPGETVNVGRDRER